MKLNVEMADLRVKAEENKDELEKKCIELLASYKVTEFTPINTLAYTTDLVWSE